MNLGPTRRSLHHGLFRKLFVHGSSFYRFRHTFCALSSEDYKGHRSHDFPHISLENDWCSPVYPVKRRLPWDMRLNSHIPERPTLQTRTPFSSCHSSQRYVPYVPELLRGLWSLDQDPIWILVDDLVATGDPQRSSEALPEFEEWRHIVKTPHLSEATLTLVTEGYLRYHSPVNELDHDGVDEEDEDGAHGAVEPSSATIPTWLVAYLLATKTNTRVEAHEGLAFCLSQLDATPRHIRPSLLLLCMCSLSTNKLAVQVPVLLSAFSDVFSHKTSDLEEAGHLEPFGSREYGIYQYNVLLTLLSQFPHVPGFARRTIQFLKHMEAAGVPLDGETAKKLLASRFASIHLVATIRDFLERQGAHKTQEQSDDFSFALMRFYAKRSNQAEASRYIESAQRIRPGQYARSYIRSFRNAADSIAYLRAIEESDQHKDKKHLGDGQHVQDLSRTVSVKDSSSTADFRGVTKRHVYTSLLHSAAVSKTISAETFRYLFVTIREAHGDDRELETVALSGMLRRKAWEQAKELWEQWQRTNRSIRSILHKMRAYVDKRERNFGDAGKVRRTLGWSKLTEQVTCRRMNMLSVDASALSVIVRALAGPKPDSLLGAFATLDEYALKMQNSECRPVDLNSNPPQSDSALSTDALPEPVQLTSRVLNCFMVRAMYFRRPDIVFRLWDGMTSYYGVDGSVATLDILIRSARLAASMETALEKVTPKWMVLSGDFFGRKPVFPNLSAEILWMLSPNYSPTPRWGGAPAWRMVRRLFREEILFANWPWLRSVDVPARAIRGDDATGKVEALKELTMDGGLWGTQIRKMGKYPHLIPSARIFREYIVMLGRVHRSSEIPEVLAWMKALNILPTRRTLSFSLALWSQVGLESLADDAWGGVNPRRLGGNKNESSPPSHASHGGEYDKLLAWLEDWVGQDNMPEESEVLDCFKYIQEIEEREVLLY
ncbi:hypothetical protein JB92DRAFT_849767 [Gautieria morchelliformis]|nr:hypothetical protein JB92DRAFT_849767 [Gautieria morchelliformis]